MGLVFLPKQGVSVPGGMFMGRGESVPTSDLSIGCIISCLNIEYFIIKQLAML